MVSIKGSFAVILSLGILSVVLLAFLVLLPTIGKGGGGNKREPSRLTGYPTWHGPEDQSILEGLDTIGAAGLLILGGTAYTAMKWTTNQNKNVISTFVSDEDGARSIPAVIYNRLLALYLTGTFVAITASRILDNGKIWVPFGVAHNVWEAAILLLIANQGRVVSLSYYWLLGVYSLLVIALGLALNFPLDVLWFTSQGLNFDYALVITYWRIWKSTRHNADHRSEHIPLTHDRPRDDPEHVKLFPATVDQPKSLIILIVAAITHLVGNVISLHPSFKLPFLFSYLIAYPLYWFYLYLDTHVPSIAPQKRIYLPETPTWKFATITIWCMILSFGTVLGGVLLSAGAQGKN